MYEEMELEDVTFYMYISPSPTHTPPTHPQTVGIAVEFCSHITRWFISCPKKTKLDRSKSALSHMGSSVSASLLHLGPFLLNLLHLPFFFYLL